MRDTAIAALKAKAFSVQVDQNGRVLSVFVANFKLTPEEINDLAVLPEIRKLSLSNCAHDDSLWPLLANLPDLEEFSLGAGFANATKGPADIEYPGLEYPPVRVWGVTDNGAQYLRNVPKLKVLALRGTYIGDPTLASIGKLTLLEQLNLNGTKVSGAGLAHLKGLRHLQRLSLVNTKVDNDGLANISDITTLRKLELENTSITNAGLVHLGRLTHLELLSIHNTDVSEEALSYLLPLRHLETLYVGSPITAVGVKHLKQMQGLHTLYIGDSNKGRDMTEAEREWVYSQLPGVSGD